MESFNAMFKCSYTNHSRHALPALLDIIMQALIVDLSREVMHGRKIFHNKRTPDRLSFTNANSITTANAFNVFVNVFMLMCWLDRCVGTVYLITSIRFTTLKDFVLSAASNTMFSM